MLVLEVLVADAAYVGGGCSTTFDCHNILVVAGYEDVGNEEASPLRRLQV